MSLTKQAYEVLMESGIIYEVMAPTPGLAEYEAYVKSETQDFAQAYRLAGTMEWMLY